VWDLGPIAANAVINAFLMDEVGPQ
jgi:hypothetical protein